MTTIRKAVITQFGDVHVVKVVDGICPPPPAGHVQIATEYTGFSGADVNMRKGIYPFMQKAPLTPGYCLVGTVKATGKGANKFAPGDVVGVLTKYDAEAELVNQPEKYCVKIPTGVDHKQATAIVLDWATAYGMVIRTANVSKGQKVFVHGISGSVGYALMKLSQLQGAQVYGTASERNHDEIRAQGATPFVYTDKKWMAAIKELGDVDAIFDPLGFDSFDESYAVLARGGILVGYGNNKFSLGDDDESRSPMGAMTKLLARKANPFTCKRATFFAISRDSSSYIPNVEALLELLSKGEIAVPIKAVWDLEDVQDAHRQWGRGGGVGSLLIRVAKEQVN